MKDFEIDVLGKKVPIIFKPIVINTSTGESVCGLFQCSQGMKKPEIQILESKDRQDMAHTLLHEIVHATLMRIGFYNTNLPPELEELICDNIATVLTENWNFQL